LRFVILLLALLLTASCRQKAANAIERLQPCTNDDGPADAYCGKFSVFEDRAAGQGRKIQLQIVLLPALRRDPRPDPLFLFAGGPGQGAAKLARELGRAFRRFQNDRDIVLVDQRGTGSSNPLNCHPPERDSDDLSKIADVSTGRFEECLKKYDADPRLYTTPIAMDDIEEVRRYLGYGPINLWGASYGTRAALVYLRQHPEAVRTVTIDGVAPPDMRLPLYFSRDGQRALDLMLDACAKDSACATAYPGLREKVDAVLRRLESAPKVRVIHPRTGQKVEVPLPRSFAAMTIMSALYIPAAAALLPRILEDAEKGDYQGLLALAFLNEGGGESMSEGMFLSVACAEDYPRIKPADIERETARTFLGDIMFRTRMKACDFWPTGKISEGYYKPVVSDKPALILSGELDPVTPPAWGEQVSHHLTNSKHIVVPGAAHGVTSAGCVPSLLAKFLTEASPANLDTACVQRVKRPPFFLSYAGPDPAPKPAPKEDKP
jgi:pimeloyl-ACP methyl ester carboxylesterase